MLPICSGQGCLLYDAWWRRAINALSSCRSGRAEAQATCGAVNGKPRQHKGGLATCSTTLSATLVDGEDAEILWRCVWDPILKTPDGIRDVMKL